MFVGVGTTISPLLMGMAPVGQYTTSPTSEWGPNLLQHADPGNQLPYNAGLYGYKLKQTYDGPTLTAI